MSSTPWTIVISDEVAKWYLGLKPVDRQVVDRMLWLLATQGNALRMPHSRSLGQGLFELRFAIMRATVEQRITYMFDVGRKAITLTTFRKTKESEAQEISRARKAKEGLG